MRTFLIAALLALTVCADIEKDENVYVLTDDNFDDFINTHDHVLVKFFAPWCGHCKKLAPEYSKAAVTLEKENLYLAQVDATVQKKLASKFEIKGYPTIKLFSSGSQIEYNAGRTEKEIIAWMRKKTGPATVELKTEEDINKFKKDNEVCLVFFGDDQEALAKYTTVAKGNDDFRFGTCNDESLFSKFEVQKNTLVLFKQFDEGKNVLTENFTKENIEKFITAHSSPLVMKFDDKAAQLIFGKNKPAIILYRDKNSEKTPEYDAIMKEVAPELNGKLQAVVTGIKDGFEQRLAEYIGVKDADLPTVRIADTSKDLKKYNMEGEITKENILKFVQDWENKKLKPHLKSQEIPTEQKGDVFTLVGKSFQKEVLESDKDVLVKFYAPWCGHCKKLAPIYEELAKKYKSNEKLLIAEIDSTENEVDVVHITGFPTLKFWPAGKKNKPVDFKGDRTVEGFEKFLKEHATNPLTEPEKDEDKGDL